MNLYLKELEKLHKELSMMTDQEISDLFKDINIEDCSEYAELEILY